MIRCSVEVHVCFIRRHIVSRMIAEVDTSVVYQVIDCPQFHILIPDISCSVLTQPAQYVEHGL